jgi:hypothetical protein
LRATINVLLPCSPIDFLPQEQEHFPLLHRRGGVSEPTIVV